MRALDFIGRALLVVSLALLAWCGWQWTDAAIFQARGNSWMTAIAESRAPVNLTIPVPDPEAIRAAMNRTGLVGRIEIPGTGVSAIVGEGVDHRLLNRGVGHVPSSKLPGETGNVVLAGHRDSFFSGLRNVAPGDSVFLTTARGRYLYRVEDTKVTDPGDLSVLEDGNGSTLTLLTCYPFQFIGPAPRRFVVTGRLARFDPVSPAGAAASPGT